MLRFGQVIGVVPEKLDFYKALHADDNEGVRAILREYNFRNFNIFIATMDDEKDYLFSYYEYVGDDLARDQARLSADPRYAKWAELTKACQRPLRDCTAWKRMEPVFYMA